MTVTDNNQGKDSERYVLEEQLARFSVIGRVFWVLWHQTPEQSVLNDIAPLLDGWPVAAGQDEISKGLSFMKQGLAENRSDIASDYAELFIGPGTLKAAPWSSVYLTEEQTTFGEPTLSVRKFYQQYGMEIETGENEPDDHIGLMFAFVSWFCEQGLVMKPEQQSLQPVFCALRSFIAEYLLTWAFRFCELVQEKASTDFYRGLAQLTSGTLRDMAQVLEAEAQPVKLYR